MKGLNLREVSHSSNRANRTFISIQIYNYQTRASYCSQKTHGNVSKCIACLLVAAQ
jgi:hypothetical protein